MKPSILFIVPATYEALKIKGVDNLIFERDEDGFFGKVITVHPFCPKTQSIALNDCHKIHEIGFDLIPGSKRFSLLRCMQYPIHFFRVLWKVTRLIKKYKIDLIRANDPFWMGLFAYICSINTKVPFCVSIHADYDKRIELDKNISMLTLFGSYKLIKRMERFIYSKATRIFPIRKTLGTRALANGAKPEKIRIIPHGIDMSPYEKFPTRNILQRFEINPDINVISFVGRLTKENYIDDILEAAIKLGHKRKNFLIVMAGGGKEEDRIKVEIAANPILKEHLILLGFQSREVCIDLRRVSKASLCLMAGFSLIEACAAGCPVISYDVEWHSELVKNNETGFLLKENDIEGVAEALDWLLSHPKEGESMGQKAKALAFDRHNLKYTSEKKIKFYSEILSHGEHNQGSIYY